ncbi:MAG: M15 family metallopeptidase [Bacteroidaceae bacterium]|nr:M15 family metallopeptidase [Bacteroidaceae bacterium]
MKILQLILLLLALCSFTTPDEQQTLRQWTPAAVVSDEAVKAYSLDSCFRSYPIPDAIFRRMQGKSYKQNCTVPRTTLRYLRVLHRNIDGKTQLGEIVCNQSIANDLLDIFRKLYEANYKIERIVLIDDYDADDERSMSVNNTSCFNFRIVSGTTKLSKHAQGLAIDINPLYNPYVHLNNGKVEPANAKAYASNRTASRKVPVPFINTSDLCYRLFIQHGFRWGGAWRTVKDYQHFEK